MGKTLLGISLAILVPIVIIVGGLFWTDDWDIFLQTIGLEAVPVAQPRVIATSTAQLPPVSFDGYKNAAYTIEGKSVVLSNGHAAGTTFFGNVATGDLNGDGTPDVAFILTQSNGGSGTFYYIVAALNTPNGFQGTNAILLGDRIAPQSTSIANGQIVVTYADRKPSEPMTAKPTVGVSKTLVVTDGILKVL